MMRRIALIVAASVLAIACGVWMYAQETGTRALPGLMPPGAMLYLEAKDFHSLLGQWNQSGEKARWGKTDNYAVMAQSRLIQRLSEAQGEFVSVAGFPVGMSLLDELAGERSALAFYDVSYQLSFVYLTQLPQGRVEDTSLWRGRAGYQPREVAGIPFFVKSEAAGNGTRTVAFAAYKGWMVVATNEAKMVDTLMLLAGHEARPLAVEPWFKQAQAQVPDDGDLRLVYNMSTLGATPQFRTYWIQRNASELKAFSAGVSELYQKPNGFEERRVMLRKTPVPVSTGAQAIREALRYVPPNASLYRAWAMPDGNQIRETVQQVILGEHVAMQSFDVPAPVVHSEAGVVGSESDLEVMIDEPGFARRQRGSVEPLLDALSAMQPLALLHVQDTTVLHDRVFVLPNSGLAMVCATPDRAALDAARARMDLNVETGDLDPVSIKMDGDVVIVSRIPLAREAGAGSVPADASRLEVYQHAKEWPHYKQLFAVVDPAAGGSGGTNTFFSGNVRSLGDSLARLQRVSISEADQADKISEFVQYQLAARQ